MSLSASQTLRLTSALLLRHLLGPRCAQQVRPASVEPSYLWVVHHTAQRCTSTTAGDGRLARAMPRISQGEGRAPPSLRSSSRKKSVDI